MPVDFSDLLEDTQLAFSIYSDLSDKWDTFNGYFMGKDYSNLEFLFSLYEVEGSNKIQLFRLIKQIDSINTESINERVKQRQKTYGKKSN